MFSLLPLAPCTRGERVGVRGGFGVEIRPLTLSLSPGIPERGDQMGNKRFSCQPSKDAVEFLIF